MSNNFSEEQLIDLFGKLDDKYVSLPLEDGVAKQIKHETNVTEIIDDHIAGKTFLTISSQGNKYQVLWDDFINAKNELLWGNWVILYER